MRFRRSTPPKTPAERQAKCRAKKLGTLTYLECTTPAAPAALPAPVAGYSTPALPAPPAPGAKMPALPGPQSTAIQKSTAATSGLSINSFDASEPNVRLSLPPAVANRLRSLVDRANAGKPLTQAERAEAEGLLDIAEYFAVQRLRRRLAA